VSDFFCAIPARGGSERLPRKNVLKLAGLPLIAYTIAAARASGCFDEIYVCTDTEEIATVARDYGARVPMLIPGELAGPLVASHRPCQWLYEQLGSSAQALFCLQPTSPLRSAEDIRAGALRFARADVDTVVSVTPIDPHYFHWAVANDNDEGWHLYFGDKFMIERPLLPPVFRPNGSIKIARLDALRRSGNFFAPPFGVIETPEERSVHVATSFDMAVCEAVLARRNS
jgi:CMP-N-acetylneuraminic acid synthetase